MRQSVKRRVWSRVGVVAAIAVGAVGLSLAPAGAVTNTTIGQTGATNACGSDINVVQVSSLPPVSYVVPAGGGLITSWSADSGTLGFSILLEVWRPAGGSNYKLVGTGPLQTAAASTGVHTYALAPPIAVHCGCGQQFLARADLAGKRVKCTACGRPIEIPRP